MEPRIQYAKTADGVSIAFYAIGQGPPQVYVAPHGTSHLQFEWQIPQLRQLYERAARRNMYVRYDPRGFGLSDRDVTDFSVEALVRDLEAVVDHLGLDRFQLIATSSAAPVAIAYAARHPERLSHLVLWCGFARSSDGWSEAQAREGFEAPAEKDWELYTETNSYIHFGFSQDEPSREAAALMRESVTRDTYISFMRQAREWDVSSLLPSLAVPTLVLHRRQYRSLSVEVARRLASAIPDARFVLLEGSSLMMGPDTNAAIGAFLREGEETPAPALAKEDVHTILFTDIESSTTLTQRLGDAKAQDLVRTHNTIVRDALKSHAGTEVKHTGDGIMASFPSASQALQCAISIQQAVAAQADTPLRVRVGLNAGEPVAEEQDLFGTAVQLARRVCDHAEPGQILVSDVVRQLAMGKGFLFSDRGDVELRGFEDPVRLHEVRWQEA